MSTKYGCFDIFDTCCVTRYTTRFDTHRDIRQGAIRDTCRDGCNSWNIIYEYVFKEKPNLSVPNLYIYNIKAKVNLIPTMDNILAQTKFLFSILEYILDEWLKPIKLPASILFWYRETFSVISVREILHLLKDLSMGERSFQYVTECSVM